MSKPALTILTDPMPVGREYFPETARRVARRLKYAVQERSYVSHPRYRGHFAVTRSLVQGLEKIGADFNYNPQRPSQLADTVVVLAGMHIRRLFAGPNIVVFSSDYNSILASPEVDAAITPCDWVINQYLEDNPSLEGRIFSWPAGVDTAFWVPNPEVKRDRIMIFEKRREEDDPDRVKPYTDYLRSKGWHVDVLERCGAQGYTHDQYRELLQCSSLMLGFTVGSESQGIAWAEAWAADVPTFLWRNTSNIYNGRHYHCSTAPYLCEQNGRFFDDLEHFKQQFAYWQSHCSQFAPRDWVLMNMSDEVCARQLYKKVISC
jgi:hypothetical protein